ncbi:RNA-directed DNA polymerase (Reverse transcriptase) [Trifolium medium]|uniref:RNA-directed DNA polymerase (Reverse transcriptase) n=1 Tax=Trifolium medium TaxID=97028 RepID=A0A392M046_9FABA|nr:RNA-directed DNA polymerase (Reverse transcriptase) [Trifolium medium]
MGLLHVDCGGLFRDYMANFHGGYAQKIGTVSVLHVELIASIIAIKLANSKGWKYLWLESDTLTAFRAFDNIDLVPWDLRNRWSNCLSLGLNLQWSHIYREGNTCADKFAILGHAYANLRWWSSLPPILRVVFLSDNLGHPQHHTT